MNARFLGGLLLVSVGYAPVSAQTETSVHAVLYARVTGYLEKVHVKPGAVVKKGDLLFEIDSADLRADFERAKAEFAVAEAMLRQKELNFERAKRLLAAKAVSREEYEMMLAEHAIAVASLNVARTRIEKAQLQFEFTKIRAPIDGTILRTMQAIGSLLKADETLVAEIAQGPTKASANIRELQKERFVVLAKVVELMHAQQKPGDVSLRSLLQAQRAALEAELELCDTPAERLALLRKGVALADEQLKIAEQRRKVGSGSETESLQARAALFEARIRLAYEEEKARHTSRKR